MIPERSETQSNHKIEPEEWDEILDISDVEPWLDRNITEDEFGPIKENRRMWE
jgi:hypothetical protein